jgi:Ran GTPase-activating protein (RanGAP) involved in mRNA processing and transport
MHRILVFFVFILSANHCFSNIEDYINYEFERNKATYNVIKDLDFGFKESANFIKLNEIGLNLILEKNDELNNLESLNLYGNDIPEMILHDFIEKLVFLTPNLKKINLSYNRLGFTGASMIGNVCHQWPQLETLFLSNAKIDSMGLHTLFIKLSKHPNLKHLDVSSNAFFNEDSAYKLGHRFAAFQKLESISFEDLGLTDALIDKFLLGMDHYKLTDAECIMPLKSIHFGNDLKTLNKVIEFMTKLDHAYLFDFYCQKRKYSISKENYRIKIDEKYLLKMIEHQNNKKSKIIRRKQIRNHMSKL